MRSACAGIRDLALSAGLSLLVLAAGPAWADDDAGAAHAHGDPLLWSVKVEQLEHRWQDGENTLHWDAQGFVGGDFEKIWLKTEGGKPVDGRVDEAEVQLLYSRMISDFWDVQAGIRHDIRPFPQTTYAAVGFQGMAYYFIEMDALLFLSEKGNLSARLEAETDLLITQKLILQPLVEVDAAFQDVEALGIGSGINEIGVGLRLRYEFIREFAPYVGVQWERKFGEAAHHARHEGEDPDAVNVLAGVTFWF